MMNVELKRQIRRARGKFAAMASTYSLGVFNDQFYKQAIILLALEAGMEHLQGWIVAVFTLPFLVFAAYAGWMADRFPKNRVVIGAKLMELVAMGCGAAGIITQSWALILLMACIMGWQSTIFSPALNGSIPELYPASYVTRANGILKVFVTVSILAGIAAAGPMLELFGMDAGARVMGRWTVAGCVVLVSLLGVVVSIFVPRRPAADPKAAFPWAGPASTLGELWEIRADRLLWVTIWADVFIWFVGSLQVQLINVMGVRQFGYTKSDTSYLVAAEVLGVAVGGLAAGWLAKGERWHRVLVPAAGAMAALMACVAAAPLIPEAWRLGTLMVLLGAAGVAGGIFMIPCEAFIQVRPEAGRRGTVIASANFAIFAGILASGPIANGLNMLLPPSLSFVLLAALSAVCGGAVFWALPRRQTRGEGRGASGE